MTPEVNWLAILPEVTLALGAAAVLLVEVQWKPRPIVLGGVSAWIVAMAVVFTIFQWIWASDQAAAQLTGTLVAFSGMVLVDGMAVFGRLAGCSAGQRTKER